MIDMFFFGSIGLFFIGMLGEYIGSIHTLVQKRPLALESERINFEYPPAEPSWGRISGESRGPHGGSLAAIGEPRSRVRGGR